MPPNGAELAERLAAVKAEQDRLDEQDKQGEKPNVKSSASRGDDTGSQVIESGIATPSKEGVWRRDRKDVNHQPPAGYKVDKK